MEATGIFNEAADRIIGPVQGRKFYAGGHGSRARQDSLIHSEPLV